MNPQFLESLVEKIRIDAEFTLQPGFLLGFVAKSGKETIQDGDVRVIALEEEVVRVTIRIRMHIAHLVRLDYPLFL